MSTTNAFGSAKQESAIAQKRARLERGIVVTSPLDTDDPRIAVEVKNARFPQGFTAYCEPTIHGSGYLPPTETFVLCKKSIVGDWIVLAADTHDRDELSLTPGERRVTHPVSETVVTFHPDGSLRVDGESGNSVELNTNGEVIINDGSIKPLVGVEVTTTTDSDGHVTSVSLNRTRAKDVFVQSG